MPTTKHLETKLKELNEQYDNLSERIDRLRQEHGIETNVEEKFKQEKRLAQLEKERDELDRQIENIEYAIRYAQTQQPTPEQQAALDTGLDRERHAFAQKAKRAREQTKTRVVGQVPVHVSAHFKDRLEELQDLRETVLAENISFVYICGRAGMGKTALVSKLYQETKQNGYLIGRREVDGIIFVDCRGGRVQLGRIFEDAAKLLGQAEEFKQTWAANMELTAKLKFFFDRFQQGCYLLIFDNFEDLLDGHTIKDEELSQFIDYALKYEHRACLLATTRRPPLFEVPVRQRKIELDRGLPLEDAVAFLREAGDLSSEPEEVLRAAAELTHCIPRALEKIIAKTKHSRRFDLARYLEQVQATGSADILHDLTGDIYAGLSIDEKLLLQGLAVFDRSVSITALRYMFPALDLDKLLDDLVNDYHVSWDKANDSYDLHPLDQQYVYALIPEGAEGSRGAEYTRIDFHDKAAAFFRELQVPKSEWKTLADLQPHLDEIEQLLKAGRQERAAVVLNEIDFHFMQLWGYAKLVIVLRERLRGKIDDPFLKGTNIGSLGLCLMNTGKVKESIFCFEEALSIAKEEGDTQGQGAWLGNLGNAYLELGRVETAIDYHQQALEISKEIGDRRGEGNQLGNLGLAYYALGQIETAIDYYRQALEISKEIGDRRGEGNRLGNLGIAYSALGQIETAIDHYQQALEISKEIGDRGGEGRHLGNLGLAYYDLGKIETAIDYLQQALEIAREIGDRRNEGVWLGNLGNAYSALGQIETAIDYYQQALEISKEIGDRRGEGNRLGNLGNRYESKGDFEQAIEFYGQALQISQEIKDKSGEGIDLENLGYAYHLLAIRSESFRKPGQPGQAGQSGDHLQQLKSARQFYEQGLAIDLPPSNYSCAFYIGLLQLTDERYDMFPKHVISGISGRFNRAIELAANHEDYWLKYLRALARFSLAWLEQGKDRPDLTELQAAYNMCHAPGVIEDVLEVLEMMEAAGVAVKELRGVLNRDGYKKG